MNNERENSDGETRREFLRKTATTAVAISGAGILPSASFGQGHGAKVALVTDDADQLVGDVLLRTPRPAWQRQALSRIERRLGQPTLLCRASRLSGGPLRWMPLNASTSIVWWRLSWSSEFCQAKRPTIKTRMMVMVETKAKRYRDCLVELSTEAGVL